MTTVCLDASLILDWLLPTSRSAQVDVLWNRWADERTELIAPPLVIPETTSVLREWVYRRDVSKVYGDAAIMRFHSLDLRIINHPGLHSMAWRLAEGLGLSKAYDAFYLAAALQEDCEFWTSDRRLFNSVHQRLSWIRLIR